MGLLASATYARYLRSEMHLDDVNVRYGLLLEAFCKASEGMMVELSKENEALLRIERVAEALKDRGIKDKLAHVRENLGPKEVGLIVRGSPQLGEFKLPLDPSVRVADVECRKVFDSAQKPLYFCFQNALPDSPPVHVMFKVCRGCGSHPAVR